MSHAAAHHRIPLVWTRGIVPECAVVGERIAVREEGDVSIFLTGSNSYLLSGELIAKLTGRYIEFEMFTLDFGEWLGMREFLGIESCASRREDLEEYLMFGGFPKALEFADGDAKQAYVLEVIARIIEKDIKRRVKIRNMDVFVRVLTYVVNNFGAPINSANIAEHFNNMEHLPLRRETVARYLSIMESAKILCKCRRFDMKSRRSLGSQEKYYLSDIGIYAARNTNNRINYGPALENVVYTYLRARNYQVNVGKIGKLEIDFITRKEGSYAYIQVAMIIADRRVEEREYRPFSYVRDGHPRFLMTIDPVLQRRDGVRHVNLMDFMELGIDLEGADTSGAMVAKAVNKEKTQTNTALAKQNEVIYETVTAVNETVTNDDDTVNLPRQSLRDEGELLVLLVVEPNATYEALARRTGFSRAKVARLLHHMREQGIIVREESDKKGVWKVVQKGFDA